MNWNDQFAELFERCVTRYQAGDKDYENYYNSGDLELLESIGYQKREFFDFVEDFCEDGEPSLSTAILIAAVRRDYFLAVMEGKKSSPKLTRENIPSFGEELGGIPNLPRVLAKAKGKLRGELDPDLMFGCGGDRKFLRENGDLHPADFLRRVWAYDGEESRLVDWIKSA
ncbi:MAG: hypothetical protein ACQKBU_08440 [Verrucomicrobiales bacterium]